MSSCVYTNMYTYMYKVTTVNEVTYVHSFDFLFQVIRLRTYVRMLLLLTAVTYVVT